MTFEQAIRILSLEPNFTPVQLKSSYRKNAVIYHPDKGGSKAKFLILNDAYELLKKSGPRNKPKMNFQYVGRRDYNWSQSTTITVEEVMFHNEWDVMWDLQLVSYLRTMIVTYVNQSKVPVNMITLAGEVLAYIKFQAAINANVSINEIRNFSIKGHDEQAVLKCLMEIINQSL